MAKRAKYIFASSAARPAPIGAKRQKTSHSRYVDKGNVLLLSKEDHNDMPNPDAASCQGPTADEEESLSTGESFHLYVANAFIMDHLSPFVSLTYSKERTPEEHAIIELCMNMQPFDNIVAEASRAPYGPFFFRNVLAYAAEWIQTIA